MSHIIPQYYSTAINLKLIDYNIDQLKCALFTGDYNEGILKDTKNYNEVSAYEVSSAGNYPTGGVIISAHSVSANDVTNKSDFAMNDIVFTASAGNIQNIRYAGVYHVPTGVVITFFDFTAYRNIIENTSLTIKFSNNLIFKASQKL